jgi:hypothetical protein
LIQVERVEVTLGEFHVESCEKRSILESVGFFEGVQNLLGDASVEVVEASKTVSRSSLVLHFGLALNEVESGNDFWNRRWGVP